MKFFLDTADIKEIREAHDLGLIDGVTTNPSLVAKTGKPFHKVAEEILKVVDGPISLEVVARDTSHMIKEARILSKIHKNVVPKIPLTREGLKAVKVLSTEGISINQTLCFSATQALLSAKAGAAYISPFIGRLDDISHDGLQLIQDIVTIYQNYGFQTEVLVASIRHPLHVLEAAKMGAHVATMPFKVLEQLINHPLTDMGLEKFLKDWEKVPGNKIV
ncbi:MAG: fructose-6-phosphate aldolase [Deltaproteobacteria bacterium]|nr:fructose-6-phosphate aldolase [Deltaproteobacteria bacterium]